MCQVMCVYKYIYVCVCVYIYICVCVYVYIYMCVWVRVCEYVYVGVGARVCVCVCCEIGKQYISKHIFITLFQYWTNDVLTVHFLPLMMTTL